MAKKNWRSGLFIMENSEFIFRAANNSYLNSIIDVLANNQLPVDDIADPSIQFFICQMDEAIIGTIGIENYQPCKFLLY